MTFYWYSCACIFVAMSSAKWICKLLQSGGSNCQICHLYILLWEISLRYVEAAGLLLIFAIF